MLTKQCLKQYTIEVTLKVLNKLQKSIKGIGMKVHRLNQQKYGFKKIKALTDNPDSGFAQALKYVFEQGESDSYELYNVKSENAKIMQRA